MASLVVAGEIRNHEKGDPIFKRSGYVASVFHFLLMWSRKVTAFFACHHDVCDCPDQICRILHRVMPNSPMIARLWNFISDRFFRPAVQQTASTTYLSPAGPEPQQRNLNGLGIDEDHYISLASDTLCSHGPDAGGHMPIDINVTRHQYARDHILQSYEVYIPEIPDSSPPFTPRYWVLYVHGGYYQDPLVTSSSFHRTLNLLTSSPRYSGFRASIAGYVSVNYRLSPHPDHPQDPGNTVEYELRNAKHPDHIHDVLTAISVLQRKFGFGQQYLLVGHGIGATLAFQVAICQTVPWKSPPVTDSLIVGRVDAIMEDDIEAMAQPSDAKSTNIGTDESQVKVQPPLAILGVEGIYSFPALHESFPSYLPKTRNAFGPDPQPSSLCLSDTSSYSRVSPDSHSLDQFDVGWRHDACGLRDTTKRIVILAHSHSDSVVDWRQIEEMRRVFEDSTSSGSAKSSFSLRVLELEGEHNDVWEKNGGQEMAKAIVIAVTALQDLEGEKIRGSL